MKNLAILLMTILYLSNGHSQSNLIVKFSPFNAEQPYQFNTTVDDLSGRAYSISTLYYYISNIHIIHDGGQDLDLSDTVIIIKNDNGLFDFGIQNINEIEKIIFGVGVPLELNHEDISLYPIEHPLSYQDPSMHWGWTSGYNQLGIIGMSDSDDDEVVDVVFQNFPLGDKLYTPVELPMIVSSVNNEILIDIHTNIDQWLKNENTATNGMLHGGIGNNEMIMENISLFPVFTVVGGVSNIDLIKNEGSLKWQKSEMSLIVNWEGITNASYLELLDINGKNIEQKEINSNSGSYSVENISQGIYLLNIKNQEGKSLNSCKIAF